MKNYLAFIVVVVASLFFACSSANKVSTSNDWENLFNGKDIDNWVVKIRYQDVGVNFGNTFRVEDGMIKVRYDQYGDYNDQFAHLFYKTPFSHYHLKLDYRFAGTQQKGAPSYALLNSGVMFHSQDPSTILKDQDWPISVEMQFLAGLGDGKPRPTGNMCSPGTDIVYNGKLFGGHCLNSSSKTYDKDEWVHAELIVLGDSLVTHIINGDTVLQYSKPTIGGGFAKGYSSAIFKPGTSLRSGYIALQSEGHPIDFKNIQLKKLE
jgi:hypothetical protein